MVTLYPVESEMLASTGYDSKNRILYALYNTGQLYEYHDVPQEVYDDLLAAESKGHFMQEKIIDVYPYTTFRGWQK